MSSAPPGAPWRRDAGEWAFPLLAAGALLAACALISPKRPFWLDEILTVRLVSDPSFAHMLHAVADQIETVPPLFHVLTRAWARAAGTSELALRLPTSLGMGLALALTWAVLRRRFGFWAASLGTGGAFLLHDVLLSHNAEARFYGLLMALAAAACHAYDRLCEREQPGVGLLVGNALVQAGLVLAHTFGPLYSGAVLAALGLRDAARRRLRPRVWLSFGAGWLAFAPWLGAFFRQADQGVPRSWIPLPRFEQLFSDPLPSPSLGVWLVAVALLALPPLGAAPGAAPAPSERLARQRDLLVLAAALFAVVPLAFVLSHTTRSIFHPRYFQPLAIAWATVLAFTAERLLAPAGWGERLSQRPARGRVWRTGAMAGILAALLLQPLQAALRYPPGSPHGAEDAGTPLPELPFVLEGNGAYVVRQHYFPERRGRYRYVLDWDSVSDPAAERMATSAYKLMAGLERSYPEAFRIEPAADFLARHRRFLFLDEHHMTWGNVWLGRLGARSQRVAVVDGKDLLLVEVPEGPRVHSEPPALPAPQAVRSTPTSSNRPPTGVNSTPSPGSPP